MYAGLVYELHARGIDTIGEISSGVVAVAVSGMLDLTLESGMECNSSDAEMFGRASDAVNYFLKGHGEAKS